MRILLIEADRLLCQQLALVLQSGGGYKVTQMSSVQQAIPLLLSQQFDLAVGRAAVLSQLPVQLTKIGFATEPDEKPPRCLGWIGSVQPLPGFAEQVRQLWQQHISGGNQ
jgi:DNA-binding NarL/FixJ family response regulator